MDQLTRRHFIRTTARGIAALTCTNAWSAPTQKSVLVLGGTGFLGPAFVNAALAAGYAVTLFNRGISAPGLFPNLSRIRGLRSVDPKQQDLSGLSGKRWDVIVDVWPHEPELAASAATVLKEACDHYVYVSSVAAYDGYPKPEITEDYSLRPWVPGTDEYESGKAESERRLQALLGNKLTVVRPGPIKGERDGGPDVVTWLFRARSEGQHIGPGDGIDPVQFVDVKDVASFMNTVLQRRLLGAYNLTGQAMSFRSFLEKCKQVTRSRAEFLWVPHDFLSRNGLKSDHELGTYAGNFPFWRPEPKITNIFRVSSSKAYHAGWQPRPFSETALDCLSTFHASGSTPPTWKDFMSPALEREVLEKWMKVRS